MFFRCLGAYPQEENGVHDHCAQIFCKALVGTVLLQQRCCDLEKGVQQHLLRLLLKLLKRFCKHVLEQLEDFQAQRHVRVQQRPLGVREKHNGEPLEENLLELRFPGHKNRVERVCKKQSAECADGLLDACIRRDGQLTALLVHFQHDLAVLGVVEQHLDDALILEPALNPRDDDRLDLEGTAWLETISVIAHACLVANLRVECRKVVRFEKIEPQVESLWASSHEVQQ
mmetsp:Transcript_20748/g.52541  ORF Transcript_20748/g.52541 Transcript_20748/m.52541 type:complete len:229 (+) Transcript_20748:3246-3932(+)